MPLESQARLDARLEETLASMPLDKMRKARSLTQVAVAERLNVDQGSVSRLEGRTDMYLSTLREYVEALGGTLELRADFPDGSIIISTCTLPRALYPAAFRTRINLKEPP